MLHDRGYYCANLHQMLGGIMAETCQSTDYCINWHQLWGMGASEFSAYRLWRCKSGPGWHLELEHGGRRYCENQCNSMEDQVYKSTFSCPLNKQVTLAAQAQPHCKGEFSSFLKFSFKKQKRCLSYTEYVVFLNSSICLLELFGGIV